VRATSAFPDTAATKAAIDAPPAPFSQVFVTITQQEHIELRLAAKQWPRRAADLHRYRTKSDDLDDRCLEIRLSAFSLLKSADPKLAPFSLDRLQ